MRARAPLVASAGVRVAVLVSGSGTILEALLADGIPVALVVGDRSCRALEIAAAGGIPTVLVERKSFKPDFDRDAYSAELADALTAAGIDLVAMAGFGTILSEPMHDVYGGRILNTHPALLPQFPGWHAVRQALEAGVAETGCTVHVAGLEVDSGPILAQAVVEVRPDDDEASLHERIKVVERRLYASTIREILDRGQVLPATAGPSNRNQGADLP